MYTLFKCFKKNNVSMRRLLNSYIMRLLENKITLITGAGRGIGRVIAEQFAKDGATVYVNDLQEGDMATWADDCASRNGVKVVPVCFDVTDSAALKAGLMSIYKAEGRIDCVVNNAAIIANQKLGMVTKPLLEKMYAVNVFAVVDILQITSRLMARNGGGSFVNIASITGVAGSPGQVAYSSSKGAVIAMTKSAAKELSPLKPWLPVLLRLNVSRSCMRVMVIKLINAFLV